ncbi:MAG: DUF1343 domain-containing protein [Ignavibacteriae bacterium]|nr:DUF1343 domain-containing protein [Ignavibacteriota bacterium]NOH00008.1 DUF1343 domain-containing protein [Ignavibacteriota bacterium]
MIKKTFFSSILILSLVIIYNSCSSTITDTARVDEVVEQTEDTPTAMREFRAAWVATVANINWPSKKGLSTEDQKREAIELLDLLKENNFNAVVFQARPQCDALYQSTYEPWSYYLTGQQGKAPEPFYDPLEFWIDEAHKRGLELHVWCNPYRAHHSVGGEVSEYSIVKTKPELVVELKNGYWWLDPSLKGTQDHSTNVVMDIVKRYDVDGVHFDDYFYPYDSYNNGEDFPDDKSWQAYLNSGGKLSRGDWRRESVNVFIERLYDEIKKEKPHVKFGLSPFGIWRPNHPESIKGYDQYEKLYADAKLWLNKGWIDYWTPQLYWTINKIPQSYPVLLGWWKSENTMNRHFWPGINIGRRDSEKNIDEVINQIMVTRGMLPESPGNVHWSIGPLVRDLNLARAIKKGPYNNQALVPSSPWLDNTAPEKPIVNSKINFDEINLTLDHPKKSDITKYVVYSKYGDNWEYEIFTSEIRSANLDAFKKNFSYLRNTKPEQIQKEEAFIPLSKISVTAVDRTGNESLHSIIEFENLSLDNAPSIETVLAELNSKKKKSTVKPAAVKLGIDVLVEDRLDLLKNKRVGLITNPSAVNANLESSIDILANNPEINLAALFGAEHGVRGAKQGRIKQEGEVDPITGIPVYSLYGDSFAPKQEWLKKIDVLIFDIQGVGSAWYTFKYSMSFAMEACAKAGIPFIVLDRPNPLGGRIVEGPYLDLKSIFRHQLPFRHGMTYGELAEMWNETENFGADLTVIKMKGWNRSMMWDETGLHWIMPSPNMGTFETAVVYPGQCLFERMNMTEARGTTKPFLLSGSSWVDAAKAADDLNSRGIEGAIFRPVHFIPRKLIPGSNPRGKPWNQMCGGVEIMLTDYSKYRSVEAALHIIDAYRKTNPDSLNWSPPEIIKQLDEPGMTVEKVIENCQEQVKDFIELRRKYLLYK